jgi:hypothetical protein
MGKRAKARTSTRAKVLATVAIIGGTAGVAGLGTFGTFTSSTTAQSQTDATGTVILDHGVLTNRLSVGATDIAPGDTLQRGFALRNNGSLDMASIVMNVSAPTSSALDTDATNGLEVKIDKCSIAWVESVTTPYTYTCAGTTTSVLAYTPVATVKATPATLSSLAALTSGSTDQLVATVRLPSTAGNTLQGLSSTLSISFTGTQRAATSK